MIRRWKHSSVKQHLWGILQGFAEIADGVVTVSTLAFYSSGFEMRVAYKRAYSLCNDQKKLRDAKKQQPKAEQEDNTNAI